MHCFTVDMHYCLSAKAIIRNKILSAPLLEPHIHTCKNIVRDRCIILLLPDCIISRLHCVTCNIHSDYFLQSEFFPVGKQDGIGVALNFYTFK